MKSYEWNSALEMNIRRKVRKKDEYHDMTDMWNLKCDTRDLFTKQKQKVCRRSKHSSLPKGKGWVGIHLQFGISTYRLLYMK